MENILVLFAFLVGVHHVAIWHHWGLVNPSDPYPEESEASLVGEDTEQLSCDIDRRALASLPQVMVRPC
jgi:hypothetical protein